MQLPLTLRRRCLQHRELSWGGGGLLVGLGLGVDDDDDDVDDVDDNTRLPMQLPLTLRRCRLQRLELRGGGGGLSVVAAVTSKNVCRRR
jgi:alpha-D-ribose 1-methylphosphonate 5-triphosphate synthase subunit PhnI